MTGTRNNTLSIDMTILKSESSKHILMHKRGMEFFKRLREDPGYTRLEYFQKYGFNDNIQRIDDGLRTLSREGIISLNPDKTITVKEKYQFKKLQDFQRRSLKKLELAVKNGVLFTQNNQYRLMDALEWSIYETIYNKRELSCNELIEYLGLRSNIRKTIYQTIKYFIKTGLVKCGSETVKNKIWSPVDSSEIEFHKFSYVPEILQTGYALI